MHPPDDEDLLQLYLSQITRRLPGPARDRRDVADELRDGLCEAATRRRRHGTPPVPAMRAAIAEFGTPDQVAAAHAPELTIRQARRSTRRVVGLLVLAGLTWQLAYTLARGVPASVIPASGPGRQFFLIASSVIPYLPVLAALGAVAFLVATGPGRALRTPSRRLTCLTATVTVALATHALSMITIMVTGRPPLWTGAWPLVALLLIALTATALAEGARANRHIRARYEFPHAGRQLPRTSEPA